MLVSNCVTLVGQSRACKRTLYNPNTHSDWGQIYFSFFIKITQIQGVYIVQSYNCLYWVNHLLNMRLFYVCPVFVCLLRSWYPLGFWIWNSLRLLAKDFIPTIAKPIFFFKSYWWTKNFVLFFIFGWMKNFWKY